MSVLALARSETTKLVTLRRLWTPALVAVVGTWLMGCMNAASSADLDLDDPRLFSDVPVPLQFQGFEMAGFGYVLVVALAALWAGSEYGVGSQIRTTLLAAPRRMRVFTIKAAVLAAAVAVVGLVTMWGTIVLTHLAGNTGIDPWALTPAIWANLGGVTLAWTLTAVTAFAAGVIARTAILPLILLTPLVIGLGDFLADVWDGARYLPVVAGSALYSDPAAGSHLSPVVGGVVQAGWALALLAVAGVVFVRRDL